MTPDPHISDLTGDTGWDEHQHLMNPMFMQSPDEIDLPPMDQQLIDHQRQRQVSWENPEACPEFFLSGADSIFCPPLKYF